MPRRIRLVVCTPEGDVLGALPGFAVESPWWPEVETVVAGARAVFGIDLLIVRLLDVQKAGAPAVDLVTYLAELVGETPSGLAFESVDRSAIGGEHPLRAHWARPGGIAATIAWADELLAAAGRRRTGPPVQVKSWNLSSILRLPTTAGDVWCKSVPAFEGHEGAIMTMVAARDPSLVPPVLGLDRGAGTVLLADVPGVDQWEASLGRLIEMVHKLVALQTRWADRIEELLLSGVPDWRAASLSDRVQSLLRRPEVRAPFTVDELVALDALVTGLPHRLNALRACGLPETLVHGDFHPGNWRFGGNGLLLLDWGDSVVGHPLLDIVSFLPRVAERDRSTVREAWLHAWRAVLPAADPARAWELVGPIADLRLATVYQGFLDGIEPSERRYHEADVPAMLRRALFAAQEVPAPAT